MEFSLASEAQCRQMAGEAVSEAGLSVGAGKFLESLSRKQAGLSVCEEERFRQAEELYKKKKQEMRLLDFDDLLLETLRLLEGGAPAGKQFTCLLIDEFQDIDPLQYRLVRAWDRMPESSLSSGIRTSLSTASEGQTPAALSGCGRMWRRPAGSSVWWSLGRTTAPRPRSWRQPAGCRAVSLCIPTARRERLCVF